MGLAAILEPGVGPGRGKSEVGYGNVGAVEGIWAARRPRK